jgi:hypothetical protein
VNEKTVALSVKTTKLTGRALAKLMLAALRQMKKARDAPRAGNQSIRRLNRTVGGDTGNLEVMGRIRDFERIAKKHDVSYHVEKDASTDPPKWTVYFKSRQEKGMTDSFSEYAAMKLSKTRERAKPSVLDTLRRMKELAKKQVTDRVKNKDRGGHEL